jgi:multisubunit Na+/H+ antiporter MnhE subunit
MWMLFARALPPDVSYWTGRRWLAAIDALAWPGLAWCALNQMASASGLFLALATALLAVSATRRLSTALLANNRYHFTTWGWGRALAWMLAVGVLLKLGLLA